MNGTALSSSGSPSALRSFAGLVRNRFVLLATIVCAGFPDDAALAEASSKGQKAPLFDNLGRHHHAISTASPLAQRYFNQGMVLLFGFNHAEAIRSFQAAAEIDPGAAMPRWAIAYAYGPNINQPMEPAAVPLAWAALQEALRRKDRATPREKAYIEALSRRYVAEPREDRSDLDAAYAEAMREVMRQHPDDLDAAALFAEAVLDTMPWDYWQPDRRPKPATIEVIGVLRNVLRRDPDHPGANHFFIHAVEAGPTPEDALPAADQLRALNLGTAHLVHMPSHIYVRTGRYGDAIDVNALASKMDRQYIAECKVQGFYPSVYYPHNLHFLWFANIMAGRVDAALKTARAIEVLEADVRCGPNALIEAPRFRHLGLLTLARFGRWPELLKERQPSEEFPLDRALWHYARGLAAAAGRDHATAATHLAEMQRLAGTPALQKTDSPIFPATRVFEVAQALLSGRVALAREETARGLDHLRRAVALEDELPYMEPPFWHAAARLTLGAAFLEADQPADAEGVFRADLDRNPRNGWALHGLAESLGRQRKTEAAAAVAREFKQSWERADGPLQFAWY